MGLRDAGLEEGPVFEFVHEETPPGKGAKTTLIEPMAFRPGTRRRRQARRQGQAKRKKANIPSSSSIRRDLQGKLSAKGGAPASIPVGWPALARRGLQRNYASGQRPEASYLRR